MCREWFLPKKAPSAHCLRCLCWAGAHTHAHTHSFDLKWAEEETAPFQNMPGLGWHSPGRDVGGEGEGRGEAWRAFVFPVCTPLFLLQVPLAMGLGTGATQVSALELSLPSLWAVGQPAGWD